MRCPLLKLVLGLTLCGCTVNSVRIKTVLVPLKEQPTAVIETVVGSPPKQELIVKPVVPIVINKVMKPGCGVYKPPVVPKPIRIDLKELKVAKSASEINTIALKAVAILHKQLENYAVLQQRSYADYLKRCVSN